MDETDGVHPGDGAAELGPDPEAGGFCMGEPLAGGISVDERLLLARWEDGLVRRMRRGRLCYLGGQSAVG
jgi:hypothetical protein